MKGDSNLVHANGLIKVGVDRITIYWNVKKCWITQQNSTYQVYSERDRFYMRAFLNFLSTMNALKMKPTKTNPLIRTVVFESFGEYFSLA